MGDSCYARMRMRDLSAQCQQRYIRAVNHVLAVLYAHECVLYGGAIRDMIKKVCPRDFDFIGFDPVSVSAIVHDLCTNGFCAEDVKTKTRPSCVENQHHTIYVDIGTSLNTNAPLIVIDLSVASSFDIIQYGCAFGVLEYMDPDFNVNMLCLTKQLAPFNCDSEYKARGNDIIFSWGVVTARSCAKYGADTEYIMQCINNGVALMLGCANGAHCTVSPANASRRGDGLRAAGYRDITDYKCDVARCRRASAECIIADMERYLKQEDCIAETRYNNVVQKTARELIARAYNIATAQVGRGVSEAALIEHNIRRHASVKNMLMIPPVEVHEVYTCQDRNDLLKQYATYTERCNTYVATKERADRLKNIAKAVFDRAISESIKRALLSA